MAGGPSKAKMGGPASQQIGTTKTGRTNAAADPLITTGAGGGGGGGGGGEARAKIMGANTDLPHKLIRASKHGEEDPRYD